eukprot:GDKI01030652.1.p2 GENE.GDKI01030652.1~~GDKI01030652.1.p2  ORF type:complete len:138 (+),score=54.11 GDKI01030652.1:201-614(+)
MKDLMLHSRFLLCAYADKYCEVTEYRCIKQARGGAYAGIEYIELSQQKPGHAKFGASAKVNKVEGERLQCNVLFVDKEANKVMVADESFDQIEVPLNLLAGAEEFLEPGTPIGVLKWEDDIVKIHLPANILSKLKKK